MMISTKFNIDKYNEMFDLQLRFETQLDDLNKQFSGLHTRATKQASILKIKIAKVNTVIHRYSVELKKLDTFIWMDYIDEFLSDEIYKNHKEQIKNTIL